MDEKLNRQIEEIRNVVLAYASFDFSKRAAIYGESDLIDSLSGGINMLGEELLASTVSLQEKEQMLKEIHHRVKNNLQIISSILSLQADFSDNPIIQKEFAECQSRIKSMAVLHEKLYMSADLKKIEINDYISTITENLKKTLAPEDVLFEFCRSDADHYTNIDQILPLGLILNELVSNSLKHAFREKNQGKIIVKLYDADGDLKLCVSDDGIGIPDVDVVNNTETLGLQLVNSLVDQINGTMKLSNDEGTTVTISMLLSE